ncbi:hypothetical protein KVA01_22580 [Kocuria varians]|uniref:DUF1541 domain-containing protein n=1 Tax=Kocuria varians TaxID=1272 RepID=A0A4Y4D915_KOCVA|nr:YdhK family protein [Kocuria varians]GED00104.1 hypothetical protein KVA01_22580 [Kocuria varians]
MRRTPLALAGIALLAVATGCSSGDDADHDAAYETNHATSSSPSGASGTPTAEASASGGAHMHSMDGGPAPAGITAAKNPTYPVGTEVTLTTDHMAGMKGAPATVVGAYDTVAYAVDYTPTDGGEKVTDHKWVVQQELKDAGSEPLADGTEVTIEADHMPGMKGAKGTVVSSTTQTVYMVDYQADGMTMKNHKWVVEDEMTPRT